MVASHVDVMKKVSGTSSHWRSGDLKSSADPLVVGFCTDRRELSLPFRAHFCLPACPVTTVNGGGAHCTKPAPGTRTRTRTRLPCVSPTESLCTAPSLRHLHLHLLSSGMRKELHSFQSGASACLALLIQVPFLSLFHYPLPHTHTQSLLPGALFLCLCFLAPHLSCL